MRRIAYGLAGVYLLVALCVTLATVVMGNLPGGTAPFAGLREDIIGREAIQITMAYGTEKEDWLQAAAEQFLATNPRVGGRPIEIELQGIGSFEMVENVLAGELQPTIISPASSLQVELLRGEWETRNNTSILFSGDDAPQPLVITPLVVVAWEARAAALDLDNPDQFWNNIHDLLASQQGWAEFGHPDWGLAKFGQTNPDTSNSGMQALVLLAYNYHNKTTGLSNADILDADFQAWLDEIQRAVLDFPNSTGTLMEDVVLLGPSQYNFVVVYENLAIENIETARGRWEPIRIYYPPANILSDHPFAILDAPWVTGQQREAAALFREFLLSDDVQTEALVTYGFRPANTAVGFDIPNNPFTVFEDYGVQRDIAQSVETPPANVISELRTWWVRQGYE